MKICMVVPCYNEAERMDRQAFIRYLARHELSYMVFVDDGSTDSTGEVLRKIAKGFPSRVRICTHPNNRGKAEAVRTGVRDNSDWEAFGQVGFLDADLSTSLQEIDLASTVLQQHPGAWALYGSRYPGKTRLHGYDWLTRIARRLFAVWVGHRTGFRLKDTQCGFKLFRASAAHMLFADPFLTRYVFDAELLIRIRARDGTGEYKEKVIEYPVSEWISRGQSKIPFVNKAGSVLRLMLRLMFRLPRRMSGLDL